MQSKCLKRISLANCGIEGPAFLAQFLQFDVGLREINLNGGDFSKPLPAIQTIAVRELAYLGIRSESTSLPFLLSLLDFLRQNSVSVTSLDLSDLSLPPDELTVFLQRLSTENLKGLRSFAFDNVRMNSAQTLSFVQFLDRHPEVTALSLNCSVDVSDRPAGLTGLLNVLTHRPMIALSFRGDDSIKFSFGALLLPLLTAESLLSVRYLDITNQSVGDRGLDALAKLLDHDTIAELDFDGSSATSLDTLCRFCERVADSRLRFARFPAADFAKFERRADLRLPEGQIEERRDRLIRLFTAKFEPPLEGLERARHILAVIQRTAGGQAPAQPLAADQKLRRSDDRIVTGTDWDDVTRIAPEVEELYRDCVGVVDGHPITALLSSLCAALTLEALLGEVE
jgi:hypothetical protein